MSTAIETMLLPSPLHPSAKAEAQQSILLFGNPEKMDYSDVEAFRNADSDAKMAEIQEEYIWAELPLFSVIAPTKAEQPYPESLDSFSNMKALLDASVTLFAYIDNKEIELFTSAKFEELFKVHELEDRSYIEHVVRLKNDEATRFFLSSGIKAAWKKPNDFGCAWLRSNTKKECTEFFIRSHFFKNEEKGWRNKACNSLLTVLANIMLHDLYPHYDEHGVLHIAPGSAASSLWLAMDAEYKVGRAGYCRVCGNPYISGVERGNPRLTCSDKCNKKNFRWAKYKQLRSEGKTVEEAAKEAHINPDKITSLWRSLEEFYD